VDLRELMVQKDVWAMRVQQSLCEQQRNLPTDPFEALAAALRIADDIAHDLAPKVGAARAYETRRRPFMFRGHVALRRELKSLHDARHLVKMVIDEQLAVVRAPERETVWKATVARLPTLLRRSTIASPPALGGCLQNYLSVDGRAELRSWMEMAGEAIKVRQAVLRHAFERAVEGNLRRLRGRI